MPTGGARVPDSKPAASPALTPPSGVSPVVRLPAEVDIVNAEQILADLLAVIDRGYPVVVADLSRTSFCDCSGVSALLTAGSHAASRGSQLRIAARASAVLRTFELTGLQLALPVYPTGAAAIKQPDSAAAGPARHPARQRP
jgi:anti-sigma B factor antagonist